jgi:hypothetical protein
MRSDHSKTPPVRATIWLVAAFAALLPLTGCGDQDDQALDVEEEVQLGVAEQAATDATLGITGTLNPIANLLFRQIINPVVSFNVQPLPSDGRRYKVGISNIGDTSVDVCGRVRCFSPTNSLKFDRTYKRFMSTTGASATRNFSFELVGCTGSDRLEYNARANNGGPVTGCP